MRTLKLETLLTANNIDSAGSLARLLQLNQNLRVPPPLRLVALKRAAKLADQGVLDLFKWATATSMLSTSADPIELARQLRTSMKQLLAEYPSGALFLVKQLDELFAQITDPVRAAQADGTYDPRVALGDFLTVEQLLKNIESALVHDTDSHARRLLCFDALDTLEGLKLLDFATMCDLARAKRVLTELESAIPQEVHELFLPRRAGQ